MTPAARFKTDLERIAGAVDRIGIAVSGGADSVALLLLAHAAFPGQVRAATVDHGLRAEAAGEARFVAALCGQLGVPHATLTVTVAGGGEGVQAAARTARYAALRQWCRTQGIGHLLTAHHADDQAETILMRLARGAGIGGLSGIRRIISSADSPVIGRPLLDWRRHELLEIVATAGITPVDDPSNRDAHYDRTHARALLAGAGWIDPARIVAAADHLADADAALAWTTAEAARSRLKTCDNHLELDVADLPVELVRRLLGLALDKLGVAADGPATMRAIDRLRAGRAVTIASVTISPGQPWRIAPGPARR